MAVRECRTDKVSPFQGLLDGADTLAKDQLKTFSQVTNDPLPCLTQEEAILLVHCQDSIQSLLLPLRYGSSVLSSLPEQQCFVALSDGLVCCCVQPLKTSWDGTDECVGDVL